MTLAVLSKRWLSSHVILGAVLGVVILHPVSSAVYWWFEARHDTEGRVGTLGRYASQRFVQAFTPATLPMTAVFALIGGGLGLAFGLSYRGDGLGRERTTFAQRELARPLGEIIDAPEGEQAEFKASARWDFRQGKMNRELEDAVVRTIAGFLNHRGGTLLVGIGDGGRIVGLDHDYRTLRRPDRDGFQQFVMTLVKNRLGGDVCPLVHLVFEPCDGKDVCRILAEPSPKPVYCDDDGVARFYVRAGNGTRELDVREALAHVTRRWPELRRPGRGRARKGTRL